MSKGYFLLYFILLYAGHNSICQLTLKTVRVGGKQINNNQNKIINLSESENELLLEFIDEKIAKNGYQYSLEAIGQKDKWQTVSYPTAHFQNIDGGEYVFKIKPSHHEKPFVLQIKKEITLMQHWWFWPIILVYILAIIGIGYYLFFLYDYRQKLKMQYVRNQIAADLHDEVGSNLNSIAIYTEVLRKEAKGKSTEILDRITANSKESVSLMQDTVWMINPKNDSTEKLLERMKSFASGVLASKNISLDFNSPDDLKKITFSMEHRKNCYLIFKEAINNIVKHAEATKVIVDITKNKDEVEIKITDNGKGFDTNTLYEGNGLQNFKERAEEAEFELKVDSKINKGTVVEMRIIVD